MGNWGGARPGSGRPALSTEARNVARRKRKASGEAKPKITVPATVETVAQNHRRLIASMQALTEASHAHASVKASGPKLNPFKLPDFPKAALPPKGLMMAMDEALTWGATQWTGAVLDSVVSEGLYFPGYAYLSELAQRPEYRTITETIADDATRKWIDFEITGNPDDDRRAADKDPAGFAERMADPDERKKRVAAAGKTDKVKALKDDQERLGVRDKIYANCRDDGFFGRSHLFLDFGQGIENGDKELKAPIGTGRDETSKGKITKGSLKRLQVVEPVWTYPMAYNAQNPLAEDWYNPAYWYVMGTEVHRSRLLKFVSRPVPDMLKPAYAFGGLSNTQLAKPYVDIWLTTRESVAALIHSFSVMVLSTDLQTIMAPGNADGLLARAAMFNALRDNQGLMVINKGTEEFNNVSSSLSGLHELQAQAQEHVASVIRIPLVKYTGISPSGLNASSEGEIAVYDDTIAAYQNRAIRPHLTPVINFEQMSLWGEVDPEITYIFEPLRVMTEKEKGDKQKAEAERDQIYVDMGAIAPAEVRGRVVDDPELPYADLDPDDVPEPPEPGLEPGDSPDEEMGASGQPEGAADEGIIPFARDAGWSEGDHPRGQPGNAGQFGPGGGGGKSGHGVAHAPQYGLQHGHFTASGSEPKASTPKSNVGAPIDPSKLKKVGAQMGSNPGGVYEDGEGKRFYVKKGKSKDHVRNEMTAAALYDLAGTPTLQYRPTPDGAYVATEMSKLDKDNAGKFSEAERKEAARDFAVHAWLGNWDAVGLGGDNLGTVKGKPTALDLGGALEYRAQGAPKGKAFGTEVGELDTLRDAKTNKDAAGVFGDMTPAEMRESARYVTDIPDDAIRAAVEKTGGPPALAAKLIARKEDIAAKTKLFGAEGDPRKPGSTIVIPAGESSPVKALNGIKFEAWEPPTDWATVDGQADLQEAELVPTKGKQAASGIIIREPDGRVWLVQPRDAYGGYEATFPKGRAEKGLSLQANAIKEAYEESGLKVRIVGHAGDHDGDVTTTRYYFAERESGDPGQHDDETEGVVLVPPEKAGGFLNRERDRKVLAGDEAPFEESKHPRDKGGKFATTSGGGGSGGSPEAGSSGPAPVFKSKKDHAAHLLTKGVTTKEMLAALNWPSISMPAMAKTLGMKLEKIKVNGETKYKGTPMTKEEIAAAKAEAAAKPKPAPTPAAPAPVAKAPEPPKENPAMAAAVAAAKTKATPQELEKAKKTVPLQLQYVPGAPQGNAQAQKLVDAFNAKYGNKPMTTQAALEQKVADFKMLAASMIPLMSAEQQAQATAQQQAKAAQAEQAKAAAAKAQAEEAKAKKQFEEQHAAVTRELGITDAGELQAFDSFVEHFGGVKAALQKFKSWQSEASNAAKSNPGHGFEKLSGFEMGCIKAYTGPQSGWINEAIINDEMTPAQFMFEKVLNSALDKLPKTTGKIQRRGLSLDAATHAKLKPGKIWTHRNFASSSDEGWGGNTKLHITTNGKNGAYVAPISSHKGEGETLFKSNLRLLIEKTETKGGTLHVHCREM